MILTDFPVIDLSATGKNIRRLRIAHGLTVRDLQNYFGFAEPRAIYKWQKGECLPTVDNLYALGILFGVPMDSILVPAAAPPYTCSEQQANACCSVFIQLVGHRAPQTEAHFVRGRLLACARGSFPPEL